MKILPIRTDIKKSGLNLSAYEGCEKCP